MKQISQKLRNNVILLSEPVVARKTAAIGFWFSTGSRSEPDNLSGVTHFVEHMLFKGTSHRSAFDIACTFDRMGGYVNAFTERENVCLYCVVPSIHVEKALEVLCDMSSNSTFNEDEMKRELQVIKSEIISSQDDPEEAALDAVSESIWPNQKISASISGSLEDVEKLKRSDLLEWYEKRFLHGELTVCITGNYNPDNVTNILETLGEHTLPLAQIIKTDSNTKTFPCHFNEQNTVWQNGVNFVNAPFQQEQFFVLYPFKYPVDEKLYYTFAILNAITGDTMSSRLFQRLREKGGYCYNVYSFFSYYEDTGFWCAYASSAKQESARILKDLDSEIKKLVTDFVTVEEVEAAKEHLCGEEMIASEDAEYRMKRLARNFLAGYSTSSTEEIIELLSQITKQDIEKAIKLLFNEENQSVVVYGPKLSALNKEKIINFCGGFNGCNNLETKAISNN